MSRSAATAPERRATPMQLALLPPAASPTAEQLIHALHAALYGALKPRADGSRHHLNCINRHVNAIPRPCSPACQFATGVLLLLEDYADSHPRPGPTGGAEGGGHREAV